MNTKTFNENFTIDRKAKGVKAMPKNAPASVIELKTADGEIYSADRTYFFFDESIKNVRQSSGLRQIDTHLCAFGLKIVSISKLWINRDAALADGQEFFKSQVEDLNKRIADFELEKSPGARSLKSFLMAKE